MDAPVAAAVFALAAAAGWGSEELAEPARITALASSAIADLTPWVPEPGARVLRERVRRQVRPLRALVADVLADQRNTWWQQPVTGSAQVHLLDRRAAARPEVRDPMLLALPADPGPWAAYHQRPAGTVVTSTLLPAAAGEVIASGAHGEMVYGWDADTLYPVTQTLLETAPGVRVVTVDSAQDWHELVLDHPDPATSTGSDKNLRSCGGLEHGPSPSWRALAEECDGVHLTFAGLLTALFAPVTTAGTTTTLWNWTHEQTCWLRAAFTTAVPLPDIDRHPDLDDQPRLW